MMASRGGILLLAFLSYAMLASGYFLDFTSIFVPGHGFRHAPVEHRVYEVPEEPRDPHHNGVDFVDLLNPFTTEQQAEPVQILEPKPVQEPEPVQVLRIQASARARTCARHREYASARRAARNVLRAELSRG